MHCCYVDIIRVDLQIQLSIIMDLQQVILSMAGLP